MYFKITVFNTDKIYLSYSHLQLRFPRCVVFSFRSSFGLHARLIALVVPQISQAYGKILEPVDCIMLSPLKMLTVATVVPQKLKLRSPWRFIDRSRTFSLNIS